MQARLLIQMRLLCGFTAGGAPGGRCLTELPKGALEMLRSFFVSLRPARRFYARPLRAILPVLIFAVILAACGGAASNSANYSTSNSSGGVQQPAATPPGSSGSSGSPTLPNGTPVNTYLIR